MTARLLCCTVLLLAAAPAAATPTQPCARLPRHLRHACDQLPLSLSILRHKPDRCGTPTHRARHYLATLPAELYPHLLSLLTRVTPHQARHLADVLRTVGQGDRLRKWCAAHSRHANATPACAADEPVAATPIPANGTWRGALYRPRVVGHQPVGRNQQVELLLELRGARARICVGAAAAQVCSQAALARHGTTVHLAAKLASPARGQGDDVRLVLVRHGREVSGSLFSRAGDWPVSVSPEPDAR